MRSTNNPGADDFRWDSTPKNYRPPRALRVSPDSPTKLLRGARLSRCTTCGNVVEWYHQPTGDSVPLHPYELPAQDVPSDDRWHVHSGLAHASDDGSAWCRIRHLAVCPTTRTAPRNNHQFLLDRLARDLAINSRRLQDKGIFTPATPAAPDAQKQALPPAERRSIVQLLYVRYLAPGPLHRLLCVAFTRTRRRCPHPVLDPQAPAGTWILQPAAPPSQERQLPLPDSWMAVYDLSGLPYSEQLRWHAQRCAAHAAAPTAADAAMKEWEIFDARVHHQHIHSELPDASRSDLGKHR